MVEIREANGNDIAEITYMYRELLKIAYPMREILPMEFLYRQTVEWFIKKEFVLVTEKFDETFNSYEITGFCLIRENNAGGLTSTVLDGEILYTKPNNKKSAYLLSHAGINYAKQRDMDIMFTANHNSAPILEKRFNAIKTFEHYEICINKEKL